MAEIQPVKAVIRLDGLVQGVGFRPFVARLARAHCLGGAVRNVQGHVMIEAVGTREALARFTEGLKTLGPAGSCIYSLDQRIEPLPDSQSYHKDFRIIQSDLESGEGGAETFPVLPAPDLAVCGDCLRELFSAGDPRRMNPFVSCTGCGPRFSIIGRIPYDRENTAMSPFALCPLCAAQYGDPEDRRCHAQTVCCNGCGPVLLYRDRQGRGVEGHAALEEAVAALRDGAIIAVKGIGGYHLACSAYDGAATAKLRVLKNREHKPLAVMFPDILTLEAHCELSEPERSLLESQARPIVLLGRKPSRIAARVYTGSGDLGAFLPYTPLQHMMLLKTGPLVMTSANVSSLPIIKDDVEMTRFFERHDALDGMLYHHREILRRLDDSVATVTLAEPCLIRRARGYVPMAFAMHKHSNTSNEASCAPQRMKLPPAIDGPPLLACGAQEKNTVCLYRHGRAILSAEIGDLDSAETAAVYRDTVADMQTLLRIYPKLAVCDLHPGYVSTQYAMDLGIPVIRAQHHHAHIASVMAEHGLTDSVIGVAFDGTGWGTDQTVWGGEFLLVSTKGFSRLGHLKAIPMLGADESVRQGWKSAVCMLHDAGIEPRGGERHALIRAALESGVNTIRSSSMGRVFDAVSAMLGICQTSEYGGQCAIELENAAARYLRNGGQAEEPFPFDLREEDGQIIADLSACIRDIHKLRHRGEDRGALAWQFHVTVCALIEEVCVKLAERHGIRRIALSGGVFANRLLIDRVVPRFRRLGLDIYRNRKVPAGDGGIALGQAYIGLWAGARARQGKGTI